MAEDLVEAHRVLRYHPEELHALRNPNGDVGDECHLIFSVLQSLAHEFLQMQSGTGPKGPSRKNKNAKRRGRSLLAQSGTEEVLDENTDGEFQKGFEVFAVTDDIRFRPNFTKHIEQASEELEYDYDSEEIESFQPPAFAVEGEPDFDSGPPQDGWEYLRRVKWEAARCPKVKVAYIDPKKLSSEQTPYMPEIQPIPSCSPDLLPSKEWERDFLADFSQLRMALSCLEPPPEFESKRFPSFRNKSVWEAFCFGIHTKESMQDYDENSQLANARNKAGNELSIDETVEAQEFGDSTSNLEAMRCASVSIEDLPPAVGQIEIMHESRQLATESSEGLHNVAATGQDYCKDSVEHPAISMCGLVTSGVEKQPEDLPGAVGHIQIMDNSKQLSNLASEGLHGDIVTSQDFGKDSVDILATWCRVVPSEVDKMPEDQKASLGTLDQIIDESSILENSGNEGLNDGIFSVQEVAVDEEMTAGNEVLNQETLSIEPLEGIRDNTMGLGFGCSESLTAGEAQFQIASDFCPYLEPMHDSYQFANAEDKEFNDATCLVQDFESPESMSNVLVTSPNLEDITVEPKNSHFVSRVSRPPVESFVAYQQEGGFAVDSVLEGVLEKVLEKVGVSHLPQLGLLTCLDVVCRAALLRYHVYWLEEVAGLPQERALWLLALSATVDKPLNADTSAAFRALLRRCAGLRATVQPTDSNELQILNALITIAGLYFGQSEELLSQKVFSVSDEKNLDNTDEH